MHGPRAPNPWDIVQSEEMADAKAWFDRQVEWVPFYGSGIIGDSAYVIRSNMLPVLAIGLRDGKENWPLYKAEMANWKSIADNFTGDFYPLLSHSLDLSSWAAWQYDRPEEGKGVVQAFRRPESPFVVSKFVLRGLDPKATYTLTDVDHADRSITKTGEELMTDGLEVRLDEKPAAAIVRYEKAEN
jgi:alpha-galactosidase